MKDVLIGIDAGTSLIKAVAFTANGVQLAATSRPNIYETLADGGVEQDMARTWQDTAAVIRALADEVPGLAGRAAGIAVTGQGDGTWLFDEAGEPVAPAWLWLDSRAADLVADVAATPAATRHFYLTGTGLNACQQRFHLMWLKRLKPEVLSRAATACHCKDWLYFKLTGERATDPSEGIFSFGDFRTRAYVDELVEILDLGPQKRLLPPIVDGTRHTAGLTAAAAAETGLLEGTPVALGYVDVVCTGLGGGLYDPSGRVGCSIMGSTGMHMRLAPSAEDVTLNPEGTGYVMLFPAPGVVAQMQSNMAATLNIDWLLDIGREVLSSQGVERSRKDLMAGLDERVLAARPASALFHPYIFPAGERGPFFDPAARAQFLGLDTRVGFAGLMRAVYEGLALAARDCYAAMGSEPIELRLTGGAAKSRAMRRIVASVMDAPVRTVARAEAGAAGAAMIAAVALGLYADMATCVEEWVDPLIGDPEAPDPELAGLYAELFPVYQQGRRVMKDVWAGLASLRRGAFA